MDSSTGQFVVDCEDDQDEVSDELASEMAMTMEANEQDGSHKDLQAHPISVPAQPSGYSLFANPPGLRLLRQRLFDVETPIVLSSDDFEAYWPYVDNVWTRTRKGEPQMEDGSVTDWYSCRLKNFGNKKSYVQKPTPEGKKSRRRRMREEINCGMSMKVVRTEGPIKIYRIASIPGPGVKHSHDLGYLDKLKRNSAIMDTARREAVKGYLPSSVFDQMWREPEEMEAAGGKFMKVSDVRNVQYAWRQANPDVALRAHPGFYSRRSRQKIGGTTTDLPEADIEITPLPPAQPRMELPPGTMRYPDHSREFLEPYLLPVEKGTELSGMLPFVTLAWASSLDGRISLAPGLRTVLSGPESKAMTHYLRSRHDAILIGVRTAIADDPSLNCRLEGAGGYGGLGLSQQPRPIIIDPHARLQVRPDMKMLKAVSEGRARAPWIIVARGAALDPSRVSTLKSHGGEYLMVHDYQPQGPGLNWEGVFGILYNEGIKSVMIEGGGVILSELLQPHYRHLIDSAIITIAPTFLGKGGVEVSPSPAFDTQGVPIASRLRAVKWQPMGAEDIILCGKIREFSKANGILKDIEEFS